MSTPRHAVLTLNACVPGMPRMAMVTAAMTVGLLMGWSSAYAAEPPRVDAAPSSKALKAMPRKPGALPVVSIYEFRSAVTEIPARGATDMFKTALVKSGQFRVVERARLNEGVIREKQLNAAGLASGKSARALLTGAKYVFEGAITQANPGESQRSSAFGIAGAQIGSSSNRDVIGIDVRIVDAATGEIVDVVTVTQAIASSTSNVSGVGNLIGAVLSQKGKSSAFVPDMQVQEQKKEGLDSALRAAIDHAVLELAKRFRQ